MMTANPRKTITTSLLASELAELDRLRERQKLSRAETVRAAIRWYIAAIGGLPPAEDPLPGIRRGRDQFARGEFVSLEDL